MNVKILFFHHLQLYMENPQYLPIDENHPCKPNNTYGIAKLMIEETLKMVQN